MLAKEKLITLLMLVVPAPPAAFQILKQNGVAAYAHRVCPSC
jgi:hypothetical protein